MAYAKTVLTTGGAGFIGSNFVRYLSGEHPDYRIINYDALTYAGNLENLRGMESSPNFIFIRGDIRDAARVEEVFSSYEIDYVVNFAAESHVDRSIVDPQVFMTTNVVGTQILLEAAKNHWKLEPNDKYSREYRAGVKFIQISTDEVYGTLGKEGLFVETMPLRPNSPYSASKSAADLIVRAYYETFGLPANITRCSNNYGPYQFPEKLIPLMITNCLQNKPLPVYGDGLQVRDWIHVADHCEAIDCVLHRGVPGEIYNIGGNNERTNIEIVRFIIRMLGKDEGLICYVKDRPGHDRRYSIDNTKITTQLGWRPKRTFEDGMVDTVQWYLRNQDWVRNTISGEYQEYYRKMYGQQAGSLDEVGT